MAVKKKTAASLAGSWTGYYAGTDLVPRRADLALDQRGARLTGELSLVANTKTGARARAKISGQATGGKITLKATLPKAAKITGAAMTITGQIVQAHGDNVILAVTLPIGKLKTVNAVGGIPLKGTFTLRSVSLLEAEGDEGNPAWVEENA
jgi:hypothetical protein